MANILSLTIHLDREVNSAEIDLGGVFLRNGNRNFAGDTSKSNYEISSGTTIITADVTFDDSREIFGDGFNFELTALDLLDPNTTCSVFIGGEKACVLSDVFSVKKVKCAQLMSQK